MTILTASLPSPIGPLRLALRDEVLLALLFDVSEASLRRLVEARHGPCTFQVGEAPARVRDTLQAYWDGAVGALGQLEVDPGGTPFQRQVQQALRRIPAGQTWTYKRLAQEVGRPRGSQAVGQANGANPIGVVIPCHRVIGANGDLTGYAGGMRRKRWLLEHEGALPRQVELFAV